VSAFEGLLGQGSVGRQLLVYGVGYEIARSLLGPAFREIEYGINSNSPLVELSPAELADMVVRNILGEAEAAERAKKYGLDPDNFHLMTLQAGEPPGLQLILEWFRRGIIEWGTGAPQESSVLTAIRESRVYNHWAQTIQDGMLAPPGAAEAVNAVQRNQISYEEGIALAYYAGLGVRGLGVEAGRDTSQTRTAFDVMLHTRGNPPSPGELLELAKRGHIAWGDLAPVPTSPDPTATTFTQGLYEGDLKDKWVPVIAQLREYLPPPRTIVAMLRQGALTPAVASDLLAKAGLPPDLIAAYIASASHSATAGPKQLNVNAVEQLFVDKLIDQPTAHGLLVQMGYQPTEADLLLSSADLRQVMAELQKNITRVQTSYVNRRIDRAAAASLLGNLNLPAAQVTQLLAGWDVDIAANVKRLSAAQIATAFYYQAITQDQAMVALEADGWTPYQAWILLSNRVHAPLPNPPPPPATGAL
jgi:hypothetical protein